MNLQEMEYYYVGNIGLLDSKVLSIIGSREASEDDCQLAADIARQAVRAGYVVMSGLAKGIDIAAMRAAVEANGKVVGVIGTSLNRYYPYEHRSFQDMVARSHLLISPFDYGHIVTKASFPRRNKLMAQLSDATIIVAAGVRSGTKYQAEECVRLKKNVWYAGERMPKWCENLGVKKLLEVK